MRKTITAAFLAVLTAFTMSGCGAMKMGKVYMFDFNSETQDAYLAMMSKLSETGDPAQAMMLEFEVNKDIDEEELFDSMKSLASEYNMLFVGEKICLETRMLNLMKWHTQESLSFVL